MINKHSATFPIQYENQSVNYIPSSNLLESYLQHKTLQHKIRMINRSTQFQSAYKNNLSQDKKRFTEEVKKVRSFPLSLGHFNEMIDDNYGIISASSCQTLLARVMSTVDRDKLKPNATVALHRLSSAVIGVIPPEADSELNAASNSMRLSALSESITKEELQRRKKQGETFDLGGYEAQQREIYEALELPLLEPQLYRKLGIDPPKGVLLYGPPGTGKTLAARAVAAKSNIPFIKVVASEFVQKYLGEGPRMVRDVFRLAREKAPCVVFIDEIDAIGQKRFDSQTGADREIQRILIELLTQMDGFDVHGNVKIMMATNRADTLDPALIRPGRLDRKIEFGYPDQKTKRMIFNVYTKEMGINEDVDIEELIKKNEKISGADIKAICREAGMQAIRDNRYKVNMEDFKTAYSEVTRNIALRTEEAKHSFYK